VLRVYGHLMANSGDRMRKAVDGAWSPKKEPEIKPTADYMRTKVNS
jgi:hypothetical protein